MKEYAKNNRKRLNETNVILYNKNKIKIRLQRKNIEPTEELIEYIKNHNGLCDICKQPPDDRWAQLSIDHCHFTNKFRGMLCGKCNKAIGLFKDDTNLLQQAIKYLSIP